jgi:hypothetical protein
MDTYRKLMGLDRNEHVTGKETALNVPGPDPLNGMFSMFVLSMVMASVLTVPVIIGATQGATIWRLFKKG